MVKKAVLYKDKKRGGRPCVKMVEVKDKSDKPKRPRGRRRNK